MIRAKLVALWCHLRGHRWSFGIHQTHIVTGAGTRTRRCLRCPATDQQQISARRTLDGDPA